MLIAYIDAGTGAMLLQWVIAVIIGSSFFLRSAVGRLFRKLIGRKNVETEADAVEK